MSKRKPMDKVQARERRNRLLESAAAAELSLIEGVREMRAISGMTQEEFARHRGVSARVIKAIELGQGNPTVATMNRIGQFFGLEVAFVPIRRDMHAEAQVPPADERMSTVSTKSNDVDVSETIRKVIEAREELAVHMLKLDEMVTELDFKLKIVKEQHKMLEDMADSSAVLAEATHNIPRNPATGEAQTRAKRKPR